MPRFRLSRQIRTREPKNLSLRVIVHASGRKSILRSDIASIVITKADGTIDKPIEEHNIGKFSQEEAEKIMREPQKIDLKKMSKGKVDVS